MKTKSYICWNKYCKRSKEKRILESELIKRVEEKNHIDLCCPECEKVIVCIHYV